MTDTMAHLRATSRGRSAPVYLVLFAAWLAVAVPMLRQLEDLPRTSFDVRNDTVWDLSLEVETGPDSVLPIVTASADRLVEVRDVAEPDDAWRFRWRFAGDVVGTSTVTDEEVHRAGFVLQVPADVEQALRQRGAPPAP